MIPDKAREILTTSKTIAIVGVSDKPDRPSYGVAKYLLDHSDYDLYFVNPIVTELFGKPVYPTLADVPVAIDIVDVFRKVSDLPPLFDAAYAKKAKHIWLQLGISDDELAAEAEARGISVVMDRCIKVDFQNL
jgi:predicted CoA-binding protein